MASEEKEGEQSGKELYKASCRALFQQPKAAARLQLWDTMIRSSARAAARRAGLSLPTAAATPAAPATAPALAATTSARPPRRSLRHARHGRRSPGPPLLLLLLPAATPLALAPAVGLPRRSLLLGRHAQAGRTAQAHHADGLGQQSGRLAHAQDPCGGPDKGRW